MLKIKHTYILSIIILSLCGCKQTKYVPDGEFLLKKNKIEQEGDNLDQSDISAIIRQQPNFKQVGVKWKLFAYNLIDSASVMDKRIKKNSKLKLINIKRLKKEDRINSKRIDKAKRKGDTLYTHKTVKLKDTINPRMFFREWYKYKIGRPPVVFDSIPFDKSIKQLNAYLRRRGYYYGEVSGRVKYKKNGKCKAYYNVVTGSQYIIDSVYYISTNEEVIKSYKQFLDDINDHPLQGQSFDSDMLNDYRAIVSEYLRNESFYGFNPSNINFIADTSSSTMTVKIGVQFSDKVFRVPNEKDSVLLIPHVRTSIREVYFHISDTLKYDGNFIKAMNDIGLSLIQGDFLPSLDTLNYNGDGVGDDYKGAIFMFNTELFIKPQILDLYNHQERTSYYSAENVEASYFALLATGLFSAIKTDLVEIKGTDSLDVHYYLKPSKKQTFSFSPSATTSNGYLGVSATVNYTNNNLFRGAEKLTFSISGGFESQPPIFDLDLNGNEVLKSNRSFNTLEIGPSLEFEIPGFFPFNISKISKKKRPKTLLTAAFNYQKRPDFDQKTLQLSYLWEFSISKSQKISIGLPGASVVKYVNIVKDTVFEQRLIDLNDLFLLSAYSNQFVWQDIKVVYKYINAKKGYENKRIKLYYKARFDPAGNVLSLFKSKQDTLDNGQYTFFGVGYSQFARVDNEFIASKPFSRKRSLHFRVLAGGGLPYGNSTTSLPYDNSFFGGGANDNRGWEARNLGPGSYKYYLDTNRSSTQIGDIRIGAFLEYRFPISPFFKAAFFVDAGNVWSASYDEQRPGGQISKDWYKEIALSTGFGLRLDFTYVIIRFDVGFPILNPALPSGNKWIFDEQDDYEAEGLAFFGTNYKDYLPDPFLPKLHFGIGYPF